MVVTSAAACLKSCASEIVVLWRPCYSRLLHQPKWVDGFVAVLFSHLLFDGRDPANFHVKLYYIEI